MEARNNWVFRQIPPHPTKVFNSVVAIGSAYWSQNPKVPMKKVSSSHHIKWHPLRPNFVKLNFDGYVAPNLSATNGFVIRDEFGSPLLTDSKNIVRSSVPVAEARAVRDALWSAREKNFSRIQVEDNSKLVIDCINQNYFILWRLKSLIKDIISIALNFEAISFQYIYSEANFTADTITSIGYRISSSQTWNNGLPLNALSAFNHDYFGLSCSRGFKL